MAKKRKPLQGTVISQTVVGALSPTGPGIRRLPSSGGSITYIEHGKKKRVKK